MSWYLNVVAGIALLASGAAVAQTAYVEGTDYIRLRAPVPTLVAKGKIEVVEVFRYGCIHCAHMEQAITPWKKRLSPNVQLRPIHVTFGNVGQQGLSRAHLAAQAMNILDKFNPVMFSDVLAGKQPPTDLAEIAKRVSGLGVKPDVFLATANSFSVSQKLKQNEAAIPRYEIEATPEFVIAGKYRVSARPGATQKQTLQIVDFLVQKELIERSASAAK